MKFKAELISELYSFTEQKIKHAFLLKFGRDIQDEDLKDITSVRVYRCDTYLYKDEPFVRFEDVYYAHIGPVPKIERIFKYV